MNEFRVRLLIPFAIPVGAFVGVGIFVFAFSRVLLAVPKYWSVSLAILLAAELLAIGGILAAVRRVDRNQQVLVGILGAIVLIGGGIGLASGIRPIEPHSEPVTIIASNLAFDPTSVSLPADTEFDLVFENQDAGIPHNVSIASAAGETVFSGEIFNGVASKVYAVPALPAGEYAFRCDVHPNMTGTAVAGGEGGAAAPVPPGSGQPVASPSAGGAVSERIGVVASGVAFDTDRIELPADTVVEVTLDNQDSGIPHNIAFYTDQSATQEIAKGQVFTGPGKQTFTFTTPAPGSYYFHCDVHPNMSGTLVVT